MAEYIEREALVAEIEANINTYWNEGHGGYYLAEDALNDSVKTAPAADVVEVVRCKDCKHCMIYRCSADGGIKQIRCRYDIGTFDEDFYCYLGEKMDGKGEGE